MYFNRLLLASAVCAACTIAPVVHAQGIAASSQVEANIPAGSLADALNRFALQAGVALVVDADQLKGKQTAGLRQ